MDALKSITERRNKWGKPAYQANQQVKGALEDLRKHVENIGQGRIMLVGNVYMQEQIMKTYTTDVDGWVFGYQVLPLDSSQGFYKRNIYMKRPGVNLLEMSPEDVDPIYGAIFEACLDTGSGVPDMELIADDAMKISQYFAIMFLHERNPSIIVPGNPATKKAT